MIKIRKASKRDVKKLILIGKNVDEFQLGDSMKGFWSKSQLERWIKSRYDAILVAEEGKNIIGFVMFAHHVPTGKVTFENGWVHPDYRGKDVISNLTRKALKGLKRTGAKYVCALPSVKNINSIKFLEKNKFKKELDVKWMDRKI